MIGKLTIYFITFSFDLFLTITVFLLTFTIPKKEKKKYLKKNYLHIIKKEKQSIKLIFEMKLKRSYH